MKRCPSKSPTGAEASQSSPASARYQTSTLKLGCELAAGHEGVHRAGQLIWHDPPLLIVGSPLPAPLESA